MAQQDIKSIKHKPLIALAIGALFLIWLALLVTNRTHRVVQAVRGLLPSWFPVLNLFLAPLLAALAAAALPISASLRLASVTLMLFSFSALYLSYADHPAAYIGTLVIILVEAYWIIPKWNERRRTKTTSRGD